MKKSIILSFGFLLLSTLSFAQPKVIKVRNADEFVAAIGSNRTIQLLGPIELPNVSQQNGPNFRFDKEYDGNELVIFGVNNLRIVGVGKSPTKMITRPSYGDVIVFDNCTNVTIENVDAGHGPEKGYCAGGVFNITNSQRFKIVNSILYGSGMEGITTDTVTGLEVNNTVIHGCTYSIMSLNNSLEVVFNNCTFRDNEQYDLVNIYNCIGVNFISCSFIENRTGTDSFSDYALFNVGQSNSVSLLDCKIDGNEAVYFSKKSNSIQMTNTTLTSNKFTKGNSKR